MITLYDPKESNFNHNGYGVLSAVKAEITEELNGMYELEIDCYLIQRNISLQLYMECHHIIKTETPLGPQLFRIYNIVKQNNGMVKLNARHIYYDSLYNLVNSFKGDNITADEAIKKLYQSTEADHGFTVSSDIIGNASFNIADANPVSALLGENGLVSLYGGEVLRDNFTVKHLSHRGTDRGFVVRHGKNLTGLDVQTDISTAATRVKPIGQNQDGNPLYLPETYIESPNINKYFMPLYAAITYSDIRAGKGLSVAQAQEEMRRRVNAFFSSGGDLPSVNAKVDFVLLRDTSEYKAFAALEEIFLGDTVTLKHESLGVDLKLQCIKYTYDSLLKRYKKIELGQFRDDFAVNTGQNIINISKTISGGVTSVGGSSEDLLNLIRTHAHTGEDNSVKVDYNNLLNKPS